MEAVVISKDVSLLNVEDIASTILIVFVEEANFEVGSIVRVQVLNEHDL